MTATEDLSPDNEESRSSRKRRAHATTDFGLELTHLNRDQLLALALPEELLEAVTDYQRFTSHGARRRQMLLIGKLLRGEDEAAIRARVAHLARDDAQAIYEHHQAERWRDRLLHDEGALTEYLQAHPDTDRDMLSTLLRRIHAGSDSTQLRGAKRALFRFLRDNAANTVTPST
ncbi:MAG: DUF615 domain-containing protein [Pseudomonadales bacterium]|nr:DUF615 domain-containing protein [Pseudomonadales bacterium]MCP5185392.1 DUF615 domain-containing protein [Pseudomonadales bacterium]